jgi:hypothetical protein
MYNMYVCTMYVSIRGLHRKSPLHPDNLDGLSEPGGGGGNGRQWGGRGGLSKTPKMDLKAPRRYGRKNDKNVTRQEYILK